MEGDLCSNYCRKIHTAFQSTPSAWRETFTFTSARWINTHFNPLPPHGGRLGISTPILPFLYFNPLPPHGGRPLWTRSVFWAGIHFNPLPPHGGRLCETGRRKNITCYFNPLPPHGGRRKYMKRYTTAFNISIHSLRMEGDSKTAQESVFHFAYPCTILQKRMQKTTFCTRKNGFFRKKGEKFGAKPSASFCAPMIRTDTFPLNFSHRISGSSMSMVSFAPICSTFD